MLEKGSTARTFLSTHFLVVLRGLINVASVIFFLQFHCFTT